MNIPTNYYYQNTLNSDHLTLSCLYIHYDHNENRTFYTFRDSGSDVNIDPASLWRPSDAYSTCGDGSCFTRAICVGSCSLLVARAAIPAALQPAEILPEVNFVNPGQPVRRWNRRSWPATVDVTFVDPGQPVYMSTRPNCANDALCVTRSFLIVLVICCTAVTLNLLTPVVDINTQGLVM